MKQCKWCGKELTEYNHNGFCDVIHEDHYLDCIRREHKREMAAIDHYSYGFEQEDEDREKGYR